MLYDQPLPRPQRAPSAPQLGLTFNAGNFYANSAPSSTTGLSLQQQPSLQLQQQQHQQQQIQQRPPVPLFHSSSTPNILHSNSVANMAGMAHPRLPRNRMPHPQNPSLTAFADLNNNNSFDSNLGAGLGPAFGTGDLSWEMAASNSAFTSINSVAGSTQTVSPKDIFNDPLGSAPPSTAFTNLTSPDIGQSPYLNDSFDTSPMFSHDGTLAADNWFSLFPEDVPEQHTTAYVAPALERTVSSSSNVHSSPSSISSPVVLDNAARRKSSVTGSPATNGAGINKSRRRKGPLPPISVDPQDKVALKRARNTLAARDSRQRKFDHVQTLEKRNAELEAEIEKWKSIAVAHGYSG